jgi:hypothetical protein
MTIQHPVIGLVAAGGDLLRKPRDKLENDGVRRPTPSFGSGLGTEKNRTLRSIRRGMAGNQGSGTVLTHHGRFSIPRNAKWFPTLFYYNIFIHKIILVII